MCLSTCRPLPSALAGEASTSFRLLSCVIKDLISMASLPSSEAATPPPSTVHSSEYESSWDPLLLSETDARGSDESPCRAYHPLTFPRDGHLPSHDATLAQSEGHGQVASRRPYCPLVAGLSFPLEQIILSHAMLLRR